MNDGGEVSLLDKLKSTPDGMHRHLTERAIVRVTKQLEEVMELKHVSRSQLADRLGKSKGWVTQLLDGEGNKTIRTLAYAFSVLGAQFETGYSFPDDHPAFPEDTHVRVTLHMDLGGFQDCRRRAANHDWSVPKITGLPRFLDSVVKRASDGT